jgi:hypothetical protein
MTNWHGDYERGTWRMRLKFEPRDLCVGVRWDYEVEGYFLGKWQRRFELYVCVLPAFPLCFYWHS